MQKKIIWPEGKKFAFTVFDDTDRATADNIRDIYLLLSDLGIKTTKSVWPLKGPGKPKIGGDTCENADYLKFMLELQAKGFEIGLHNVTYHSSLREETLRGIEKFKQLFGHYPLSLANHAGCDESIYWGDYRLTGINKFVYNMLQRNRRKGQFRGAVEGDKYFWGDACKEKIKYVRNFVFQEINTLKVCPFMPYHDPARPYVNYWYASSDGQDLQQYNKCLSEARLDQLEEEGGACIMYTHFGVTFLNDGKLDPRFKFLMERLARKDVWAVPVSTLLDFLLKTNGHHDITPSERTALERKWIWQKIKSGGRG